MRPFSLIFHETVKHNINFCRFRDSLVIRNPNKNQSELNPEDLEKQDTLKITRKYFSKKITNLLCFHKSSSTASAYHCKAIKSLKLYGSALQRCPLRLTKKMELLLDTHEPLLTQEQTDLIRKEQRHTFLNQLYGYKCLESLEVRAGQQLCSLGPVKSLRNLNKLALTLNVNQIVANSRIFLRLKSLKKFSLTILKYNGIQQEDLFDAVTNFCEKILSKQGLETVHLNLKGLSFNTNSKPIEKLLDALEKAKLPSFNVQLSLPSRYNLDPRTLQRVLNHVNVMTLAHLTGPSLSLSNRALWEDSNYRAQRKLEIEISHYGLAFHNNLRQVSSQSFDVLESVNSFFKQHIDRSFPLIDKLQAKNLQSFTFSFDKTPDDQKLTAMCTDLAYILKNSPNLKHLNLKGMKIDPFANGQYAKQKHAIFEALASLRDLETLHLEDISLAEVSFKLINKTLAGLYRLKSLNLSFNIRFAPEVLNSFFQFKNLRKLTDLQLELPALSHKAQVNFIDNLIHLRNLQVMNIKEGSQLFKNAGLRWKMLKGMDSLVNLREVEISSRCTLNLLHLGFGRPDGQDNKRIAADIRDKLDELFDHNEKLTKFVVSAPNCYEVKAIRN